MIPSYSISVLKIELVFQRSTDTVEGIANLSKHRQCRQKNPPGSATESTRQHLDPCLVSLSASSSRPWPRAARGHNDITQILLRRNAGLLDLTDYDTRKLDCV